MILLRAVILGMLGFGVVSFASTAFAEDTETGTSKEKIKGKYSEKKDVFIPKAGTRVIKRVPSSEKKKVSMESMFKNALSDFKEEFMKKKEAGATRKQLAKMYRTARRKMYRKSQQLIKLIRKRRKETQKALATFYKENRKVKKKTAKPAALKKGAPEER